MSDGWIEWTGGECPVKPDADIEYRLRHFEGQQCLRTKAGWCRWDHSQIPTMARNDIIAYRRVQP